MNPPSEYMDQIANSKTARIEGINSIKNTEDRKRTHQQSPEPVIKESVEKKGRKLEKEGGEKKGKLGKKKGEGGVAQVRTRPHGVSF